MASKIADLLKKLGAEPDNDGQTWTLTGGALGIEGLVDNAVIQVFAEESIGFSAPRALTAVGPIWIKEVGDESALLSTVRDAHRRLHEQLDKVASGLSALSAKPTIRDGLVAAEKTIAGYVVAVEADKTGALRVMEIGGREVLAAKQRLGKDVAEFDEEGFDAAVRETVNEMRESGLLVGRGVFEASTARADMSMPAADDAAGAAESAEADPSSDDDPAPSGPARRPAPRPRRRPQRGRARADWDSLSGSAEPVVDEEDDDDGVAAQLDVAAEDEAGLAEPPPTGADGGGDTPPSADPAGVVSEMPPPTAVLEADAGLEDEASDDDTRAVDVEPSAEAEAPDDVAASGEVSDADEDLAASGEPLPEGAEGADVAANEDDAPGDKPQGADDVAGAASSDADPDAPGGGATAVESAAAVLSSSSASSSSSEEAAASSSASSSEPVDDDQDEVETPPEPAVAGDEPGADPAAPAAENEPAAAPASAGEADPPPGADVDAADDDAAPEVETPGPFVEDEADATRTVAAFTPPKEALPSDQQSSSDEPAEPLTKDVETPAPEGLTADAPDASSSSELPAPSPAAPRVPTVTGNRPLPHAISAEPDDEDAPMPEHTVLTPLPQLSSLRASMTGTQQGEAWSMSLSAEDSEEELARAMEEMSSDEDSLDVSGADDSGAFDSDERPTDVAPAPTPTVPAPRTAGPAAPADTAVAPQSLASPPPPSSSSTGGPPHDAAMSMAEAWEASTEHRPLGKQEPIPTASLGDGPMSVDSALVEPIVSSDDAHPVIGAEPEDKKPDSITDQTAMGGDAQASDDAGFAAEVSQTAVPEPEADPAAPAAPSLPEEFDDHSTGGTGEVHRTSSAESTFQKLSDVVGSGLSTGKTGAIELDAEAFATLRAAGQANDELEGLLDEETQLTARLAQVRERIAELRAERELKARADAEERPTRRLAASMKKIREERGEPDTPDDGDENASAADAFSDGVALEDVRRALAADKTQMLEGGFDFAPSDDEGGVFDSPSQLQAADKVALVVQSQKALERLTRELEGRVNGVVPLSAIDDLPAAHAREMFGVVVFVRPRLDARLTDCLDAVRALGQAPKVLLLSPHPSLDDSKLIDLRLDLPKKTGDVADTVVEGIASLR